MLIDFLIGIYGVVIVLVILAEGTKKPEAGIFGMLLLLITALWVLDDGTLQYKTGETISTNITGMNPTISVESSESVVTGDTTDTVTNISLNATMNQTETSTTAYLYEDFPDPPYIEFPIFVSLVMILFSIYGLLYYAMEVFKY